ncbi:Sushi domain containing protein, partial [Euroglyphus maynei]
MYSLNVTDMNVIAVDGLRSVEYNCHDGYRLIGQSHRHCDQRTGQWIGLEPYCERITCLEPMSIPNGFHRMYGDDYYDQPVVGSRTVYECRPGFIFMDPNVNDTRICDRNGQWSGTSLDVPQCEPIDCGHPESLLINSEEFFLSGAQFRMINGSTKFSSLAELICSTQDVQRSNLTRSSLLFRCREDGLWTEVISANETSTSSSKHRSSTSCVRQRHNGFLYFYAYGSSSTMKNFFRNKNFYIRETSVNILHLLAGVVVAAFLSILIIVILMFKRNIIEWPEAA